MARTRRQIEGLVVAVIGGANGIGKETVRALLARGAQVAIGDYDGDAADRAADELAAPGQIARGYRVDVSDADSVSAFYDQVQADLGAIQILVNSAGVMWVGRFEDEPDSALARQLSVNLHGAINAVRLLAPQMRERGDGHIITLASAASFLPTPGEATYSATKHGIYGYHKAVRTELRGTGVQLSLVMPTVVETALAAGTSSGAAAMLQPEDVAEAVISTIDKPRFEVAVPRYAFSLWKVVNLLPAGPRDAILSQLVPDQVNSVDRDARQKYEDDFQAGTASA